MSRVSVSAIVTALAFAGGSTAARAQSDVIVSPSGAVRTLTQALQLVRPGARVVVKAGVYREPTIVVQRPVSIVGEQGAVLESVQGRQILTVQADDVTIRGLELRHVATSFVEDRAAIRVQDATNCVIENNTIEDAFFGIYLARVDRCRVIGNRLHASKAKESASGNGIHLWTSNHVTVAGNEITGHRDGIYLEFVHESDVRDNVSEGNLRYGMHFMYSDDCRYVANTFRRNGSGVAVMYTKRIEMTDNRFEDNWGAASYGLLLKEILEPVLRGNHFNRNTGP